MKSMQIGQFKSTFSKVIAEVKKGQRVVISYGKRKEKVAVLIPYSEYQASRSIELGLLEGKATYGFADDFDLSPEEMIGR